MFCNLTVDFGGVNFPAPHKDPDVTYIGFVSVFSGCNRAVRGHPCPDCQNPSLWGHNVRTKFNLEDIVPFVRKKMALFRSVQRGKKTLYFYAVLGGEPLDQNMEDLVDVHNLVEVGMENRPVTVLFSGYPTMSMVNPHVQKYVERRVHYLKLGPYLGNDLKKEGLESGLATENQEWITMNQI